MTRRRTPCDPAGLRRARSADDRRWLDHLFSTRQGSPRLLDAPGSGSARVPNSSRPWAGTIPACTRSVTENHAVATTVAGSLRTSPDAIDGPGAEIDTAMNSPGSSLEAHLVDQLVAELDAQMRRAPFTVAASPGLNTGMATVARVCDRLAAIRPCAARSTWRIGDELFDSWAGARPVQRCGTACSTPSPPVPIDWQIKAHVVVSFPPSSLRPRDGRSPRCAIGATRSAHRHVPPDPDRSR